MYSCLIIGRGKMNKEERMMFVHKIIIKIE